MENIRDLKKALKLQGLINDLLHFSLNEDMSVEELLDSAINSLVSIEGFSEESRGGIWLACEGEEKLELKVSRNFPGLLKEGCKSIRFGECVCGKAAQTGRIVSLSCLSSEHKTYVGIEPHGHYSVPIMRGGKTLGVITLYLKDGHARQESEERFLYSFAEALAGIIERKRAEARLIEHLNIEKALARLSGIFLSGRDTDLNEVLNVMGSSVGASSAYLFLLRKDSGIMDNAFEWCAPGAVSFIEKLRGIDMSSFPWLTKQLAGGENISVPDTSLLPPEAHNEQKEFDSKGIKSILIVPVRSKDGALAGFMGFEDTVKDRRWTEDQVRILRVAAEIVSLYFRRQESEAIIRQLAYYDPLTGLPNRRLLLDRLEHVIARGRWKKRLSAVLFLDLDRFKIINDTLGHAAGDKLLQAAAFRLKSCLHEGDTVSRLGGDEFTILLEEIVKPEDIIKVIKKVFSAMQAPMVFEGREAHMTVSIGVSVFPDDGENAQDLIKNADLAMYQAKKQSGSSYCMFSPSMNEKATERLKLEGRLWRALEKEEFIIHYQPLVDTFSGNVTGFEALVRWDNPQGGLIPPSHFIPLAEESGIIVDIGKWVLRTACSFAKRLHDTGFTVSMAVNTSIVQFRHDDFSSTVKTVLNETGLEPGYLEIELTESVVMGKLDETVEKMRELKKEGIRFSIDDFGTGYSSLSYLRRLPLDTLKIDKSFVNNIMTNQDDRSIAIAIIRLAHSLKLKVLAEGVENAEQAAFLKVLDCDMMQGCFFSKPLQADKALLFLKGKLKAV